jgi:prevent-host-death family protein
MAISIAQARKQFTELLKEAKKEPVVITRHSVPDSVLISYERYLQMEETEAYLDMLRIAEEPRGSDVGLQEMLEESRRELEERAERRS